MFEISNYMSLMFEISLIFERTVVSVYDTVIQGGVESQDALSS